MTSGKRRQPSKTILIPVSHGKLEARLDRTDQPPRGKALIAHPHPRHGGNMHSKTVYHLAKGLLAAGIHVLRFNFRGVGASTGTYDQGVGEREDARVALDYLRSNIDDVPILTGGFSFGSHIALKFIEESDVVAGIGIGPPSQLYDFDFLKSIQKPCLLIQGSQDEFDAGDTLVKLVEANPAYLTLSVIEGADHFLNDQFDELRGRVLTYFTLGPGQSILRGPEAHGGRGIP